ncbi:hypothetical protein BpHYR1_042205 [Brachionus plicatilis]|uniref:Uncharacterized protein n=1 Tax=Brachionus plicatilis TaxID=10195 RepID=A0A3M7SGM4_BRAPC|nr:hypothetical protein BpHYR1_042205 [Brachionus plicatilis]
MSRYKKNLHFSKPKLLYLLPSVLLRLRPPNGMSCIQIRDSDRPLLKCSSFGGFKSFHLIQSWLYRNLRFLSSFSPTPTATK